MNRLALLTLIVSSLSLHATSIREEWRWWFLASTTDSATIELYNKVEERYLYVSDLQVLRRDLEAVYKRLADTIVNQSDAQTAALLIRLFHYSAARPFATAKLCDTIGRSLGTFIVAGRDSNTSDEVRFDLIVAAGLAADVLQRVDDYPGITVDEVNDRIAAIRSVYRLNAMSTQKAHRLFLQAVDAVTKQLEYSSASDSLLSLRLAQSVGVKLDSMSKVGSSMHINSELTILNRVAAVLKVRIYRSGNMVTMGFNAAALFGKQIAQIPQIGVTEYPEVRLRSSVNQFIDHYGHSVGIVRELFSGLDHFSRLLTYDLSVPGRSLSLRDRATTQYVLQDYAYRYGTPDNLAIDSSYRELERRKEQYDLCYGTLHPLLLDTITKSASSNCGIDDVLDNVCVDTYLPIRRALVYKLYGQIDQYVNELVGTLWLITNKRSQIVLLWRTCELLLQNGDYMKVDNEFETVKRLLLINRIAKAYVNDIEHHTPAYATTQKLVAGRNVANITTMVLLSRGYRQVLLDNDIFRHDQLDSIGFAIFLSKSSSTANTREWHSSIRQMIVDNQQGDANVVVGLVKTLQRWNEEPPLAPYVSGDLALEPGVVRYIEQLSSLVNLYESCGQVSTPIRPPVKWEPKADRVYIIALRYPTLNNVFIASFDGTSDSIYKWAFVVRTSDTMHYLDDIDDSVISQSVEAKRRALSYGINESTALDTLLYSLIVDASGLSKRQLVFIPEEKIYGYNPYLIRFGSEMLIDKIDIAVATKLTGESVSLKPPSSISILKTDLNDLYKSEDELESIHRLFKMSSIPVKTVEDVKNESDLAVRLAATDVLHIASHALQPDLIGKSRTDSSLRELIRNDDVANVAKMIWSPLIQYRTTTLVDGPLFGDGYLSPIEIDWYNISLSRMVFLSTCQTVTATSVLGEPPDGLLRVLFTSGVECVVTSTMAVPDKYAPDYSACYYQYLIKNGDPHLSASMVVRDGIRTGKSLYSYGMYYPISFSSE